MALSDRGCPIGVQKVFERLETMCTRESLAKALSFQPRPDDILLTTGIKCGSAWTQQILHGLRSGGNMDFEEIDSIIPIIEAYYDYGEEDHLDFTQPFEPPRMFRMHFLYEQTIKGFGKYVVVTRNPKDSVVSAYFFFLDWVLEAEEVSMDEFVEWFIIQDVPNAPVGNAYQLKHLISWYPHRKDENVLWLHYEDMKEDLSQCIYLIAKFLNIGLDDPELLKLVEEQASLSFMQEHRDKFNLHQLKLARNESAGLPRDRATNGQVGRVRTGEMNQSAKHLSTEMIQKIDMKWKTLAEPVTGYDSYEKMRAAINEELGRSFGNGA